MKTATLSLFETAVTLPDSVDLGAYPAMGATRAVNAKATRPVAFAPVYAVRLVREGRTNAPYGSKITRPDDVYRLLAPHIGDADRENLAAIFLDVKNNVLGLHLVSVGDLSSAIVNPREVFKAAILANAASMIVVHNHPSGDVTPSPEDGAVTRRLIDAGNLLGIAVLDHVVIGFPNAWTSLKEKGLM